MLAFLLAVRRLMVEKLEQPVNSEMAAELDNTIYTYFVEGRVEGRGVVAMTSCGWGVAKGEELSTSPIAASIWELR